MLKTRRSGDLAAGVFLALLGLVTLIAATDVAEGAGGRLHPRTFPMIVGALLLLGGGILSIRSLAFKSGADKAIDWPDATGRQNWVVALAMMVAYVGLSKPLGFLLTTFLFVATFIRLFGKYTWSAAVGCALGAVGFVYFLFVRLLDLTLPKGPLSFL